MAASGDDLQENLETYEAQLRQVEAALMIDADNEELMKLQSDLQEVIALTKDLLEINEATALSEQSEKDGIEKTGLVHEWKPGDRCSAFRKLDKQYHNAIIDMIADDRQSCTIKFDSSGSVDVVKLASIKPVEGFTSSSTTSSLGTGKHRLTREELERKREIKKKKLLKKKQRMKDFEEAREAGKQRWQSFYKSGLKGKSKIKGLNKKSIFASSVDGKGKIGIGTCGSSGKGMTQFPSPAQYMYKK